MGEDVVLHSPILFRGFEGREVVDQVLTHVAATFEGLSYIDELIDGNTVALRFKARSATCSSRASTSSSSTRTGGSPS